jgi:hypothetical protein
MEKIAHYSCFFVCEKFYEQIPIKTIFLFLLFMLQSMWQALTSYRFQSTIALFKCASISQHNESLEFFHL